jgi:hypothetical protein
LGLFPRHPFQASRSYIVNRIVPCPRCRCNVPLTGCGPRWDAGGGEQA